MFSPKYICLEYSDVGRFRPTENFGNRELWSGDAGAAQSKQSSLRHENIRQTKS